MNSTKRMNWHRVSIVTAASMGMTGLVLFVLWSSVQAGRLGSGAGGCGNFIDAVQLAQENDTIAQMITPKESEGAVITKDLRISGGWFPDVNCEEANQYFTETIDFLTYGFSYVAPAQRSELNHFDSVLTLDDSNDPNFPNLDKLVLENLILHTYGSPSEGGGITGVISDGAEVLIDNTVFTDNFAFKGGGIYLILRGGSHLIVEDSEFSNNQANDYGGGFYVELWEGSRLTVRNSQFTTNSAHSGAGFEVRVYEGSEVVISNTQFLTNSNYSSLGDGGAGRIFVENGRVLIHNSIFHDNGAGTNGGGLYIEMNGGEITIQNSRFTNNTAGGSGGALYVESVGNNPATFRAIRTIFDNNTPDPYQFVQSGSGVLNAAVLNDSIYLPIILNNPDPDFKYARILGITLDENFNYIVEFETNFDPDIYDLHVHFFFDTVAPEDAGVPAPPSNWILYDGPTPFTGYNFAARPDGPYGAERMCILVANHDHSVRLNTGNCVELP